MSQKKVQKEEEKPPAGPLRKHRSRTEKIDDLNIQTFSPQLAKVYV